MPAMGRLTLAAATGNPSRMLGWTHTQSAMAAAYCLTVYPAYSSILPRGRMGSASKETHHSGHSCYLNVTFRGWFMYGFRVAHLDRATSGVTPSSATSRAPNTVRQRRGTHSLRAVSQRSLG